MKMRSVFPGLLTAFVIFTSCKKSSNPVPPDELLGPQTDKVLHLSFNGNLDDGSGNDMDAVNSNNISFEADRFGRVAQAAAFGGPSNITHVAVPSLSSKVTGFPFSISLWFKTNDLNTGQTLVKSDGGESATYSGYWLQLNVSTPGSLSFSFGDNTSLNSGGRNSIHTPSILAPNTWYHAVVNVRAANDMDVYIDGTKRNDCIYDGAATTMVYTNVPSVGVLGVFPNGPSAFNGLMDDYRVYKKTLSQTEISALYNFRP
jgi:hypothetical protein